MYNSKLTFTILILGIILLIPAGSIPPADAAVNTWSEKRLGFPLLSVHFTDELNGWATGEGGNIFHTTTGGDTWTHSTLQAADSPSVFFTDKDNGWIVSDYAVVHHYDGTTWDRSTVGNNHLKSVFFTDKDNGWTVGVSGTIFYYNGTTWTPQTSHKIGTLDSVHFFNAQTGWIVGDDGVTLYTTNGGDNWTPGTITPNTLNRLNSVYFTDELNGWAVGDKGIIISTIDGGETWSISPSPTSNPLNSVHFVDKDNGWAVGDKGTLLYYNGSTWTSETVGYHDLTSVFFTDENNGWVVDLAARVLTGSTVVPVTYNHPILLEKPNSESGDNFGSSVSMSGDKIVIGAYNDNNIGIGAAYLYDMDDKKLQEFTYPSSNDGDSFGNSVSILGDKIVIGAKGDGSHTYTGSAYIYDVTTGNTLPPPTRINHSSAVYDEFGYSVSMSDDKIVVGAKGADNGSTVNAGAAYLFDMAGEKLHEFTYPSAVPNDSFGNSVSMSDDKVVVGAKAVNGYAGSAYLYDATTGILLKTIDNPDPKSYDHFGNSVAMSGDKFVIGAPGVNGKAGAAYIFDINGYKLQTIDNPSDGNNDNFGWSVSMSDDKILVGAKGVNGNAGAAYLFDMYGNKLKTIDNPTPNDGDKFGSSVSLSGEKIVIGAPGVDNNAGAVYLYLVDSGGVLGGITPDDTKKGGSDDNAHKTRPTFGLDHNTGRPLVEGGFSFNGVSHDITDNFWTPFAEQEVKIGDTNTFTIKTYADKQLHIQEFLFGIPEVGEAHNAELGVEVFYGYDGTVEDVIIVQKSNVIDVESVEVITFDSKCTADDDTEKCNTTQLSMKFLEPLKDKVMALKAIDYKNRYLITYLNDGFDVTGESLNPMIVTTIPGTEKYESLITITQNAKYSDTWTSEDGRTFEVNDSGTFKWTNETYERTPDTGSIKNRLHSEFAGYKDAVTQKAIIELLELCPTCLDSYTDFDDSWTYELPETYDFKTDDPILQQKLIDESKRAQEIMNYLLDPISGGN